uniref:Uncharacterized protein n=1 Tax=Brugia timori TaxID=42155 RepID=A0A0R3QGJ3_9BILA
MRREVKQESYQYSDAFWDFVVNDNLTASLILRINLICTLWYNDKVTKI